MRLSFWIREKLGAKRTKSKSFRTPLCVKDAVICALAAFKSKNRLREIVKITKLWFEILEQPFSPPL